MKIDDIVNEWVKDAKIDQTELAKESLKTPTLHSKYIRLYAEANSTLRLLRIKRKEMFNTLSEYYRGDLNNPDDLQTIKKEPWEKKVLKQDISSYVDADDEMVKMNVKCAMKEQEVEVLLEIIKAINNRGFAIKNAIDFLRWTQGSL